MLAIVNILHREQVNDGTAQNYPYYPPWATIIAAIKHLDPLPLVKIP